jgi:large subunit ribosomal protein L31
MKQDIHPSVHNVIFVDTASGAEFFTISTLKSEEKRTVDGMEYFVIPIEISSASHPFYTGKHRFVDTAGRVDKFAEKMTRVAAAAAARKGKKVKKEAAAQKKAAKKAEKKTTAEA